MPRPRPRPRHGLRLRHALTATLDIAYHEFGPSEGRVALLLHGFPYDVESYCEVAPLLAEQGWRVIVPYLRGHGPTRFRDPATPRSGQQAALGTDVIDLMDALDIPAAVLAGYDWGGRAACVVAATRPERVTGLVSVNGYLIQDIGAAMQPLPAELEAGFWYFFYFLTERGWASLAEHRRDIAEVIWRRNSADREVDRATFDRTARSFENPDYVDVVIHSYRHRLGAAAGSPAYADLERMLASQPVITVPAITLDGLADANFPATDGSPSAVHFAGPRAHRRVPNAGHNLPQDAPGVFAQAVSDVVFLARR